MSSCSGGRSASGPSVSRASAGCAARRRLVHGIGSITLHGRHVTTVLPQDVECSWVGSSDHISRHRRRAFPDCHRQQSHSLWTISGQFSVTYNDLITHAAHRTVRSGRMVVRRQLWSAERGVHHEGALFTLTRDASPMSTSCPATIGISCGERLSDRCQPRIEAGGDQLREQVCHVVSHCR